MNSDVAAFREVMAAVCTPVAVVTTMDVGLPHGTTVSAFASLSLAPPMLLVSLDRSSQLLTIVRRTGRFGVNVLGSAHADLARRFAGKGGPGKFDGVAWEPHTDVPRIPGAGGFVGCRVTSLVPGGDHVIVLGHVVAAEATGGRPLVYHRRVYGTHTAI
ncbi:flavin reductase family protein [Saccharomonospora sp. NPDC046836]|uniref:flavin reductase family protein n=1 Tax=Saccharomonospora sp. NPDC046836 TaxID=3156921 RepID=UPI0033DC1040